MATITLNNTGEDTQQVIAEIQADIEETGGLDITVGVNARGKIDLTGKKSHIMNLCTQEFMDRFLTALTKKEIKALIRD